MINNNQSFQRNSKNLNHSSNKFDSQTNKFDENFSNKDSSDLGSNMLALIEIFTSTFSQMATNIYLTSK